MAQKERLKLDVTEPAKSGDVWTATMIATMLSGDVDGVSVVFYCDGMEVGVATTDAEGRTAIEASNLKPGPRLFEAKVSGKTLFSAPVRKVVKEVVAAKIANSLTYTISSSGTTRKINFSLFVGGKPVVGKKIRVENTENNSLVSGDLITDADGLTSVDVQIKKKREIFRATVLGMDISKTIHIYS